MTQQTELKTYLHELNNQLSVAIGMAQILKKQTDELSDDMFAEKHKTKLNKIVAAIEKCIALSQEIKTKI